MPTSDVLLSHYNPNLPVVMPVDTLNYGVGDIMSYIILDGLEKDVGHAPQTHTTAKKNYSQIGHYFRC